MIIRRILRRIYETGYSYFMRKFENMQLLKFPVRFFYVETEDNYLLKIKLISIKRYKQKKKKFVFNCCNV